MADTPAADAGSSPGLAADQVTDVLRRHVDPGMRCTGVVRGPVGNGQETWFLDVVGADGPTGLVLRRTAAGGPLEWTDRADEAAAVRAAARTGVPVPRIHAVAVDDAELGAPYLVMDRLPGGSVAAASGEARHALLADLGRHLASLHAGAAPDPRGRDGAAATREEVRRWRARYEAARLAPVPLLDALLAWCESSVPASLAGVPAVQLWGDAGAHNALGQDGRITGLLDWELAHPGHPLEDLASAMWIEQTTGGGGDVVLADAYAAATGQPVDRAVISWFLALMCTTRSVMITVGAAAFARGRTTAPNLAGLGLDLPTHALADAARHAGWGVAPAPVVPPRPATTPAAVAHPTGAAIDRGVARFLQDEVLPCIDDGRTRRGLKTAVALLDTAALRSECEPAVAAARAGSARALLADLDADGATTREEDPISALAAVAVRVETDASLSHLRPRVRAHLLQDLAHVRGLLAPLHRLYHPEET